MYYLYYVFAILSEQSNEKEIATRHFSAILDLLVMNYYFVILNCYCQVLIII